MDKIKIIIDIISGNKQMNEFMHAADAFDNSKQLGEYKKLVISGKKGIDINSLTNTIKESFEKLGKNVVFVSIRQVGPTMTNDYDRYIMPGVSAISNGHKWGLFKNYLEQLGYEVETDEQMKVTSVKLKC